MNNNQNNKQNEKKQFDWFVEQRQMCVAFDWFSKRTKQMIAG